MSNSCMLHASLVSLDNRGVLLSGKSGCGKSDLALRLIENKNAVLVADDVVLLENRAGQLYGKAPQNIAGKLEIRGIGVVEYPYMAEAVPVLHVRLADNLAKIERMPKEQTTRILGLEIKQIDLYAGESSAPDKIMVALRYMFDDQKERE